VDYGPEIDAALSNQDPISKDKVLLWIEPATDLPTLGKLYRITGDGYYRIQPELGKAAECRAVRNYLLECIRQDVPDNEEIEGRWDAAATLHFWLRHLLEKGDASDEIEKTALAITDPFVTSEDEIRLAIEQGFLEHALESGGLRPYFEHWSKDARLRETWLAATQWADDHPDFSWNLHQELLKKIGDKST
jgi:hypothetical protein